MPSAAFERVSFENSPPLYGQRTGKTLSVPPFRAAGLSPSSLRPPQRPFPVRKRRSTASRHEKSIPLKKKFLQVFPKRPPSEEGSGNGAKAVESHCGSPRLRTSPRSQASSLASPLPGPALVCAGLGRGRCQKSFSVKARGVGYAVKMPSTASTHSSRKKISSRCLFKEYPLLRYVMPFWLVKSNTSAAERYHQKKILSSQAFAARRVPS